MFRTIVAAVIAAGSLAAPAADASPPTYDCRLVRFQNDVVTGASHQGVLVGYVVHEGPVSINCRIVVNGVTEAQSGADAGTGGAVRAKDVSFSADDTDVVQICADYTLIHGSGTSCVTYTSFDVTYGVYAVLELILRPVEPAFEKVWPIVDPLLCSALKPFFGNYGAFQIGDDGDVSAGNASYDCPPYDD